AEAPVWGNGEAIGVKPIRNRAAASLLVASGNHIRAHVGYAQVGHLQWCRTGVADLQREAPLEGGYAVDAPTGDYLVGRAMKSGQEGFTVAERQIQHVADNQALRNILRGKRPLS